MLQGKIHFYASRFSTKVTKILFITQIQVTLLFYGTHIFIMVNMNVLCPSHLKFGEFPVRSYLTVECAVFAGELCGPWISMRCEQ